MAGHPDLYADEGLNDIRSEWIGSRHYGHGFGGKTVLIVSESCHRWGALQHRRRGKKTGEEISPDYFTIPIAPRFDELFESRIVKKEKKCPPDTHRLFTNIAVAFLNHVPDEKERREFWHSVAFWNLTQDSIGGASGKRLTDEMWSKYGSDLFLHSLSNCLPDVIAVFGSRLWEKTSAWTSTAAYEPVVPGVPDPMSAKMKRYKTCCEARAFAFRLPHPLTPGFNGRDWHKSLMEALEVDPGDEYDDGKYGW